MPVTPPIVWRGLARAVVALAATAAVAAGCAPESGRPRKTHLAVLPAAARPGGIAFSEAGDAWAFVVATDEGDRVVGPRGTGAPHDRCGRPQLAPGESRVLYWARDDDDAGGDASVFRLVTEDGIGAEFVGPAELVLSPRGSRWAALGRQSRAPGAPLVLIVDGAEHAARVDLSFPVFSADDRYVAYLAARDDGRVALVVDGIERHLYEAPAAPCARAAWQAASRPDLVAHHPLRFLSDGSLVVVTRDAEGWGVYRDEERLASYPLSETDRASDACRPGAWIVPSSLATAAGAPYAFWWERLAGTAPHWRVVRNGTPPDDVICHDAWRAQPPEVAPDGRRYAYACAVRMPSSDAEELRRVFVVTAGARYGPYADVWGIALAPDGSRVAYGAHDGSRDRPWSIHVDGAPRVAGYAAVWRPRLDATGTHLAWQAQPDPEGPGVLGLDARRITRFDEILWGPEFTPDHVAWIIRRGRKLTRIQVPL